MTGSERRRPSMRRVSSGGGGVRRAANRHGLPWSGYRQYVVPLLVAPGT